MHPQHVRSPLVWVGGKAQLLNWLLPLLSVPCRVYAEPFGGSAAVLLNRARCPVEIYNDADGNLVNLLRCVREHPAELQRLLADVPYCRERYQLELAWLRAGCPGDITDLQRASRWWWLNVSSFSGLMTQGFSTTSTFSQPERITRRIASIDHASARLHGVLIEHLDFREVITTYDSPDALFYCDPPYVDHEELYHGDGSGFGAQEHRDLATLLAGIQGRAAVSYYPCALVDELYPASHWRRHEFAWHTRIKQSNRTRESLARTELLLTNYDPPAQGGLFVE